MEAPNPPNTAQSFSTKVEGMILDGIRSGEMKPGDRLGSARQLAARWDASYGAVRQSLEILAAKGIVVRRPRAGTFISAKAVPIEEGQNSNGSVGRKNIIGLLVPDIRTPESTLITRHLQDVCNQARLEVLVSSTDNQSERYEQVISRHISSGVRGLAIVAPQDGKLPVQTLLELQRSNIPVVSYAGSLPVERWSSVQTDLYQASYLPMKHLCDIGRKRIAYLSYPSAQLSEGLFGVYRAIADSGLTGPNVLECMLPVDLYLKANGWANNQQLCSVLEAWLSEHRDVDALCCAHDHIAAAAWSVLRAHGKRVPEDVAITGSCNMPEVFGLSASELTTVDTRVNAAAFEMLRILLRDPAVGSESASGESHGGNTTRECITIKPKLVIGSSTIGN